VLAPAFRDSRMFHRALAGHVEPYAGIMNPSQLGNVLSNGEDYRPHEVKAMMEQLWAEYVAANPRLFEVDD